jgi:LPXTG-motif cell wall-anchored protein
LNLRESGDDGNLLSALPNILPKTGWEQYAILVLLMVILLGGALVWKQE